MWYLFVALYLFIGFITYDMAVKSLNRETGIIEQLCIMIIHPIIWIRIIYMSLLLLYRSYKNNTTIDEEIEKWKGK